MKLAAAVPDDTKTLIIKAAQEAFAEKGLSQTSVSEIAQQAGVVDSLLYHYFKGKEDLLFSALAEKLKERKEHLSFHLEGIIDPLSRLSKMIWLHMYSTDERPGETRLMKNLLFECRSNKNFYVHPAYAVLREYTANMVAILRQGMALKVFRSDLNVAVVRDMLFGLLDEHSLNCVATPEARLSMPDFEDIMNLVLPMIMDQADPPPAKENETAARILRAAEAVFAQKGYHAATILEVANRAGVSEGTVYTYYKRKRDILFSLAQARLGEFEGQLAEVSAPSSPLQKLRLLIRHYPYLWLANRDFLKVFLLDVKLNRQFYLSGVYEQALGFMSHIDVVLNEGKEAGVFRSEVNNRIFKYLFLGTFSHLATRWFVVGQTRPTDKMAEIEQVATLLCRAVAAQV